MTAGRRDAEGGAVDFNRSRIHEGHNGSRHGGLDVTLSQLHPRRRAGGARARGYVLKDMDADDLTRAIVAVGHGEAIFSPGIAARMTRFFSDRPPSPAPFPDLTDSERKVLRLMAGGANNAAIAHELSFSPKTVRNYISNVFRKLQVADRAQAIVAAREAGIDRPGEVG